MSLTMQRLLPTVVLPMLALAGLGAFLRKDKNEAQSRIVEDARPAAQLSPVARIEMLAGESTARLHLHDVGCATCTPQPISEPNEHITGFTVSADGKHVLFVSDAARAQREGNTSLYRYDLGTHRRVELTPDETLDRDVPLLPRKQPDMAIYSARSQGEASTKVFAQSLSGRDKPKLVYVDPEPGELVEVSDDGTRGVFRRFIAPEQSIYIAVDLRKRES